MSNAIVANNLLLEESKGANTNKQQDKNGQTLVLQNRRTEHTT